LQHTHINKRRLYGECNPESNVSKYTDNGGGLHSQRRSAPPTGHNGDIFLWLQVTERDQKNAVPKMMLNFCVIRLEACLY